MSQTARRRSPSASGVGGGASGIGTVAVIVAGRHPVRLGGARPAPEDAGAAGAARQGTDLQSAA